MKNLKFLKLSVGGVTLTGASKISKTEIYNFVSTAVSESSPVACCFSPGSLGKVANESSVPLPTVQSETWLIHAKVREPVLNPLIRMNFLPLALVSKGKARKVHTNRGVQRIVGRGAEIWITNFYTLWPKITTPHIAVYNYWTYIPQYRKTPDFGQRRRDDNKNKIFAFEGGGLGAERKNRPKRCFSWETPRQ